MPETKSETRKNMLVKLGAEETDIDLILDYNSDIFDYSNLEDEITFPLEDENFIKSWKKYEEDSSNMGVFPVIRKAVPHLNFPINDKIAEDTEYKTGVFFGHLSEEALKSKGLNLKAPEELQLAIISTDAGSLPMLYIPERIDFENIIRAVNHSNTNFEIFPELTSVLVHEFRNSERITILRERFHKKKALMNLKTSWRDEFAKILLRKELYADTFIAIYGGGAAGLSGENMGLPEDEWQAKSIVLGREKEAITYYMRRIFKVEKPHPYVDFIAWFSAIYTAFGNFQADKLLKLMIPGSGSKAPSCGLAVSGEKFKPEICDIIKELIEKAAHNLEDFCKIYAHELEDNDLNILIISLTNVTLEELASSIEPLEKIFFSLEE